MGLIFGGSMNKWTAGASVAAFLLVSALAQARAEAAGVTATANIKLANGTDAGTVTMTEATGGVLVKFELKGLPAGPHGVHVHDVGKCEGDFSSAGAIYNPLGSKHGLLSEEGPMAGDLPNLYAAADGTVTAETFTPFLNLNKDAEESIFDSDGVAVLIYEKADDHLSDPEGGAEPRIACGVLQAN